MFLLRVSRGRGSKHSLRNQLHKLGRQSEGGEARRQSTGGRGTWQKTPKRTRSRRRPTEGAVGTCTCVGRGDMRAEGSADVQRQRPGGKLQRQRSTALRGKCGRVLCPPAAHTVAPGREEPALPNPQKPPSVHGQSSGPRPGWYTRRAHGGGPARVPGSLTRGTLGRLATAILFNKV